MTTLEVIVLQVALVAAGDAAASEPPPAEVRPPEVLSCDATPEGMGCVPGGPFIRGIDSDPHWPCNQAGRPRRVGPDTQGQSKIWLQTFYMDKTEVTIEAYQACVKEKKCRRAGPSYSDFSRPKQPITGLNWYHAARFCEAQGKHLPTEAEWEKAARGPDGDLYPWGNEPATCELAVIRDDTKGGRSCGIKKLKGGHPDTGRVIEVGSRPAHRYGLYDMVGNAEEWTADWYVANWEKCGEACQGINPKGPCDGAAKCRGHKMKTVRGGSWYWPAPHAMGIHRRPHYPANKPYHHFGFRCAASPQEAEKIAPAPDASPEPEG